MASGIYHSFFRHIAIGDGNLTSVTVKVALVTSSYTFNKDHEYFSDITNEVSGTGYSAGGATVTCSVTDDDTNDRVDIVFGSASWTTSTITARGAVYYVDTAGAASTDWLIAYVDFGSDYSSSSGTFSLSSSTVRIPT